MKIISLKWLINGVLLRELLIWTKKAVFLGRCIMLGFILIEIYYLIICPVNYQYFWSWTALLIYYFSPSVLRRCCLVMQSCISCLRSDTVILDTFFTYSLTYWHTFGDHQTCTRNTQSFISPTDRVRIVGWVGGLKSLSYIINPPVNAPWSTPEGSGIPPPQQWQM